MAARDHLGQQFVIVHKSSGAFRQQTAHPVLHRADCRHAKKAEDTEAVEGDVMHASGFDRACKTCKPLGEGWVD